MTAICIGSAQVCVLLFSAIPVGDAATWYIDATNEVPRVTRAHAENRTEIGANFFCHGDHLSCLDAKTMIDRFSTERLNVSVFNLVRVSSRGNWIRFTDVRVSIQRHDAEAAAPVIECDAGALKKRMSAWELDDALVRIVSACLGRAPLP